MPKILRIYIPFVKNNVSVLFCVCVGEYDLVNTFSKMRSVSAQQIYSMNLDHQTTFLMLVTCCGLEAVA